MNFTKFAIYATVAQRCSTALVRKNQAQKLYQKLNMLIWLSRQSVTLVRKILPKFAQSKLNNFSPFLGLCWCGSAVEHYLGKVGVTGPIPVTSSINKIAKRPKNKGFQRFVCFSKLNFQNKKNCKYLVSNGVNLLYSLKNYTKKDRLSRKFFISQKAV